LNQYNQCMKHYLQLKLEEFLTSLNFDLKHRLRSSNDASKIKSSSRSDSRVFTQKTLRLNKSIGLISNMTFGLFLFMILLGFTQSMKGQSLNVDLSTYVRVGRYNLPEPTRTTAPANSLLAQEVSAVTYNWDTNTLFVVGDGSTSIVQVSKTGQLIDSMTLAQGSSPQGTEFYDTEGLTYIGNGQFVMSEERDRHAVKFTYVAGTTLSRSATQTVKLGTFVNNIGTEGLSYDPITSGYIVAKEITPIGIFQTGIDFTAGTATNGSATTVDSVNLFDPALLGVSDIADVFALSNIPSLNGQSLYNNLLVLSQENAKVVNISRSGLIANTLTIVSDAGNPLDVASQQHEGLTMDSDGILYVVSENGGGTIDYPQLWVYAPSTVTNQAPTAIALTNTTTSILENSNTTAAVKVADIAVTDDGLGTNNITLSGADANSFQIIGSSLYIKAGTVLDYETKTSYNVTVNVDDTTIGSTPDASVNYVLAVSDVLIETTPVVSVSVTEVAPWSSSTTNVAADWFEVTNNGTTVLTIAGWKVDDNSNSFSSALALTGITSIAAGESVIFLETSSTNSATIIANFKSTWFGANVPSGLQVGYYTGSGAGLSTGGDAVNLYDASGVLKANVTFGVSTTNYTFNNAASLNSSAITTLSQVGVNGALAATNDAVQIGSPGTIGKLLISEVAPWSSSNSPIGVDWFEVTNTKAVAVDITGWKMDDNSQSPAAAVALSGINSINAGESVIFMETSDLAGKTTAFLNNWFGTNPSSGIRIGNYTGSSVGLSSGGDQVNLYNTTSSTPVASVLFGASPTIAPFTTFDNSNGINGITTAIAQMSAIGTKGAFIAANSTLEIGSPGTIKTSPCPTITATAAPASSSVCVGSTTTVSVTAAGGTLPYVVTGSLLTVGAGTFNYTVTDAKGCTATTSVTIIEQPLTENITPVIACDTYTWNGITYAVSGLYTGTTENCVTEKLNLTITPSSINTTTIAANNSYTWNGTTYITTGLYTGTTTNCVTEKLDLTITKTIFSGPSTAVSPYVLPVTSATGVTTTSMLTVPEAVGGYKMVGIPDGLGAFDNNNGTFTLLMNHELGNTLGAVRTHGAKGAFVSKWIINKSDLSIASGSDLMTSVYAWNTSTQSLNATPSTVAFQRFCSADLPEVNAFYNPTTGLGTQSRIFMHGEEGGTTGYQVATVSSGVDAGKAYILGKFNISTNGSGLTGVGAWENALANPFAQDKTIVVGNNDGGTGIMNNSVAVYQGTKTNTGTEVDKAGLTNGTLKFVNVAGNTVEIPTANATSRATNITSGTAFTLNATSSTTFSRPEDGAWDPADASKYYFVTTDRLDQVNDGIGTQIGRSRLWRLNFADITNPDLGGTIDMLLDGTEGQVMMDNMTFDKYGHILLLEDVGGAPHNGKVWQYTIATDQIKMLAKHDAARFGDIVGGVAQAATLPFSNDEETSGIIDMSDILGAGNFLVVDQAHYNVGDTEAVEGGQLLKLYNPDTFTAAQCATTSTETVSACDTYTWNGKTYTKSGIYTNTSTNVAGCFHTATLNLTITPSSINTTPVTACGSYKWSVNDQTYTASGTYSVVNGCHTEELDLTINSATITTQPAATFICSLVGSTTSFSAATNITEASYAWQYRVVTVAIPNPTWITITSANAGLVYTNYGTDTLGIRKTTTLPTVGTQYRVMATGACGNVTSDSAALTILSTVRAGVITSPTSVCLGSDITFTLTKYTGTSFQWQSSPISSTLVPGVFTDIPGATATTYTAVGATATMDRSYRVIVTNSCNGTSATTTTKTIKVDPTSVAGNITLGGGVVCSASNSTLRVAGYVGRIQWQYSTNDLDYVNAPKAVDAQSVPFATTSISSTGAIYSVTGISTDLYFRAKITSGACSTAYTASVHYVIGTLAEVGTISPALTTLCPGTGTSLTLSSAIGVVTWQKATNLTTPVWTPTTNHTLTLATGNLTVSTAYRAMVTIGGCSTVYSDIAYVNVVAKPIAKSITSNVTSPVGGLTTPLCTNDPKKTLTIGAGYSGVVQWQVSTVSTTTGFADIDGATNASYIVANPSVGANYYRATFTNTCGVIATNTAVTIYYTNCTVVKVAATKQKIEMPFDVFAYPNPFSDTFNLSLTSSNDAKVNVAVFEMSGKLIEQREVIYSEVSSLHIGNNYPSGVYNVIVSQGTKIKTLRVVKQ
jgi:uncharacterized protein YjiK